MNDAPTHILLIRHARSEWNTAKNLLCGSTDVPLSEQGRQEIKLLDAALASKELAAVYCTPLQRSIDTARAIAQQPVVVEALRELDYGAWEGLAYSEIAKKFPDVYRQWIEDPADVRPPGGDTPREVSDRAWAALEELVERHAGETIAVVAHKTVNRLILGRALGISIGRFRTALKQNNLAVNEIRFHDGMPKVIHLNDTCHLPHDPGPDA